MKYAPPFQRTNGFRPVLLTFAVLMILPLGLTDIYSRHILILIFLYAVLASNWDISLGLSGVFNFAHLAYFAIGLYTYALLSKVLHIDPWFALAFTPIPAIIFGLLLAAPILRLDGIYVILVTIAAVQLLQQITVSQSTYTGGTGGMILLPRLEIAGYRFSDDNRLGYYYLSLTLLAASTMFLYKLERSSIGRAMKAMRDNKYYAISRGVSEARTRAMTMGISAIFPALAGGFQGAYLRVASPDVFGLGFLTVILSILLLGGVATVWGPLIAAFVVVGFSQLASDYGAWRNIFLAIMILGVIVIYPGGLFAALQESWRQANRKKTQVIASWSRHARVADRLRLMGAPDKLVVTRHGPISVCDTQVGERVILFIHGNSSCKEIFHHQFQALRTHYRLVAFDLPGHGVSPNGRPDKDYRIEAYATIAADIIERLQLGKPFLFGWSLGGYVALEYAASGHPLCGLAISGTSPIATYPEDMSRAYQPTTHMELASTPIHSPHEKADYAWHTTRQSRTEALFAWRAVWRTDGEARRQAFAFLPSVKWHRQMTFLRTTQNPFAMINGPEDPFINHKYCARLMRLCRNDIVHLIDSAGHAPFLEKPETFNETIRPLLNMSFESQTNPSNNRGH
ncbi:MAG: alpha/beta fold hydrolase [Aestuariivita sp.]|nr:alpha/beta fold hydrolase [Aestuariivita sp.]